MTTVESSGPTTAPRLAASLRVTEATKPIEKINTYRAYQQREGLPVVGGFAVDLRAIELASWARTGGRGAFINLEGNGGTSDTYVAEILPGASLAPERHLFEETIYVLDGHGSTSVWYDERRKATFEWGPGSLFAIPLNAWHQHFNARGSQPARYLAATNAPMVMNLFHNVGFVFDTPYQFADRFGGDQDYFDGRATLYDVRIMETNFVPDIHAMQLYESNKRGAGGRGVRFELTHNTTHAHVSEFPVGTYKKAHRHGPDAHVVILQGTGFSLFWPQGGEPQRYDWKPGSMFIPPDQWFHQHFNGSAEPARYLALRWGSARYDMGGAVTGWTTGHSYDIAGAQIEYEDEDPKIHQMFEAELTRAGAQCRMKAFSPYCTAP